MKNIRKKIVSVLHPMTPTAKKKDQKFKRSKYMREEYRKDKKYLNCVLSKEEFKKIKTNSKSH